MGKPYTYTRLFKPLKTYDYRFWVKLENNLVHLEEILETYPIEETKFSESLWYFPLQSKHRRDLYNIIILIAKMTGTKIMWKWGINEFDQQEKLLLIIGENTRVIICTHILDYALEGIFRFEDYLKNTEKGKSRALGYKTITSYVREKVFERVSKVLDLMTYPSGTINDQIRINRLENYIMGRYKLDYKNYGQLTNTYDNAVSNYFYPRRMML
jgi:hypothetical protein